METIFLTHPSPKIFLDKIILSFLSMVKIMCKRCKSTGYTASPDYIICECGGEFMVIQEKRQNQKEKKCQIKNKHPLQSTSL